MYVRVFNAEYALDFVIDLVVGHVVYVLVLDRAAILASELPAIRQDWSGFAPDGTMSQNETGANQHVHLSRFRRRILDFAFIAILNTDRFQVTTFIASIINDSLQRTND